jgi:2'-5' RNA ligase
MQSRRIFIAIDISDSARAACGAHTAILRQKFPQVRVGWERPEKLHLTLKFLGSIGVGIVDDLETHISEITSHHERFKLRLSNLGTFPSKSRPRILWIGLDDPSDAILPLQSQIEDTCHRLGFEPKKRAFRPHLTIGRIKEPQKAAGLADVHMKTKIEPVAFEVAEIVIYESKLQPTGSVYSVVSTAKLQAAT